MVTTLQPSVGTNQALAPGLGDREAMLNTLELAYAARDVRLIDLSVDMKRAPYRAEPRFAPSALSAQRCQ